jgi:putative transposase
MRFMRLVPIGRTQNSSKKNLQHKIYPYLPEGLTIDRPNQVWYVGITHIPMPRGFVYLVAIMDWYSRKVLGWRSLVASGFEPVAPHLQLL